MLSIPCPWCGERSQVEFAYGGDAAVKRPADPAATSDQAWHDYVFVRDNPKGPLEELWYHAAGCRRFFKVRRDTVTHAILGAAPVDGAGPEKA